jgi:hypothetical protein
VRRFVAVTVSVGFASALVRMPWLAEGTSPSLLEWEQLIRLGTAFFVILLGWEWHNKDLGIYGETGVLRFFVDVLVVLAAFIFLVSSTHELVWLASLVAIFALYLVWDAVNYWPRFLVFRAQHRTLRAMFRMFRTDEAMRNKVRGPFTNFVWLVYFAIIFCCEVFWTRTFLETFFVCLAIVGGVLCLAHQGSKPDEWTWRGRIIAPLILLMLFGLFFLIDCCCLVNCGLMKRELRRMPSR